MKTLIALFLSANALASRNLVDVPTAPNRSLIVGVAQGLDGIDEDIEMAKSLTSHPAYQFSPAILREGQGTRKAILSKLRKLSAEVGEDGSLLFYYSGHGMEGTLSVIDGELPIGDMRDAMEQGRTEWGPMARLIFISDSCFAGSLMDPLRAADLIYSRLSPRKSPYWKKLFVFASSRDDEPSGATYNGSVFTLAMTRAFYEIERLAGTMREWVTLTQQNTKGQHPVARFSDSAFESEKLVP